MLSLFEFFLTIFANNKNGFSCEQGKHVQASNYSADRQCAALGEGDRVLKYMNYETKKFRN